MLERDPVSRLFDDGARRLLDRAYARPGQWVGTRITAPDPGHVVYFGSLGINVLGKDAWGRDRWAAGFVRAVYHQHKWYRARGGWGDRRMAPNRDRAIRYELGVMKPALGVIPRGRAIRIMSKTGGAAAERRARSLPASERIYTEAGPGPRFSEPGQRDW